MDVSRSTRANAIRALAMDAIERAGSGHPGMPLGMADIAEVVWGTYLRHNPADPAWPDRDRFVISNGHGSMLLYALLHLSGYDLPMAEIRRFRQLGSATPGHPEHGITPGVETTTGPLGQGLANAVGMAMAERSLAARFNVDGHRVVDHHTYVLAGDGCLMEGISHEACSLAGTLRLGRLIVFYDDNGISIDGPVEGWFTDDTAARFEAYGWHVVRDVDGHEPEAIIAATDEARAARDRPSLVMCRTIIGHGAPNKAGTAGCHGAPLGADEIEAARAALDWPHPPFEIPVEVAAAWSARARGACAQQEWATQIEAYQLAHPERARELLRRLAGRLPDDWAERARTATTHAVEAAASIATRKASEQALQALAPGLPEIVGGSADLAGSNLTRWSDATTLSAERPDGQHIGYGVREFAMCAITNGIALHGGLIPFCGTFLVFSDYARSALRMAALMGVRGVFVLTHDSIGLGEDGPTHQPVEHAASLRLIPNLSVWRPCDAVETLVAWRLAIERADGPTCLLLSRQSLAHQTRSPAQLAAIARGGYVLEGDDETPDAIVIASGSEVAIAREAAQMLAVRGVAARVVSMPSCDVFEAQPESYRRAILPPEIRARVAVEAGVCDGWRRYVGLDGEVVGLERFGESAPAPELFENFGFTAARIIEAVEHTLARCTPTVAEPG